jgi:hypothetical protein
MPFTASAIRVAKADVAAPSGLGFKLAFRGQIPLPNGIDYHLAS